jgi:hypothetical protein
MQRIKKHIAVLLLLVFSLAALPHSLLHKAFANHTDTEDNYCDFYHKDLGTHLEGAHTNCDIFKTNTPIYDALTVTNDVTAYRTIISVYQVSKLSPYIVETNLSVSSRGPPTC